MTTTTRRCNSLRFNCHNVDYRIDDGAGRSVEHGSPRGDRLSTLRRVDPLQPADPRTVGRYRLLGRLGAGGMGRVYLGETPEGAQAAVKVIRDDLAGDPAFRARFRREVSAAVSVAGLFTARVLDADPDGDPPWLATQYVEGPSLRDAVRRRGPLPEEQLVPLALGLAEALGAIHAAGLIHRDLKPANVLLSPDGPRVIDFGIARTTTSTQLTGTGEMIGTPDFMAPEQVADGDVGPSADVFAFGSTLTFAATGVSPFAADQTAATLWRIVQLAPELDAVPRFIAGLVGECLAKTAADRPTAQQLAVRLRAMPRDIRASDTLPGPSVGDLVRPLRPSLAPLAVVGAETLDPASMAAAVRAAGEPDAEPATEAVERPTPQRRRWLVVSVVAAVLVVAGGATALGLGLAPQLGGGPVITDGTPVSAPIDPNDPRVRYVDRLCASGSLLVTLADAFSGITVTGDPTVAKRDFLASVDRSIGVVDTALADLVPLRDEAPTPQVKLLFGQMVTEFTSARAAFTEARATVAASEPLDPQAYSAGIDRFTDGARNLALAANLQKEVTLPDSYTAVSDSAPHCKR